MAGIPENPSPNVRRAKRSGRVVLSYRYQVVLYYGHIVVTGLVMLLWYWFLAYGYVPDWDLFSAKTWSRLFIGAHVFALCASGLVSSFAPKWLGVYDAEDGCVVGCLLAPFIGLAVTEGILVAMAVTDMKLGASAVSYLPSYTGLRDAFFQADPFHRAVMTRVLLAIFAGTLAFILVTLAEQCGSVSFVFDTYLNETPPLDNLIALATWSAGVCSTVWLWLNCVLGVLTMDLFARNSPPI